MRGGSAAGTLSGERRAEILEIASKLRVTDVRDGLDWMGLHARGSVSPEIRPLFRTRACGFARTVATSRPSRQCPP